MLVFAALAYDAPKQQNIPQTDEALFHRIACGEKEAFRTLYSQTAGIVFSYALSILRNLENAEDAMQETFLRIRSAAHLYRPMGKPLAWMLTITKNICLMKLRERNKNGTVPLDSVREPVDLNGIADAEDRMVLETALRVLSREEYQIVMLHAVAGLKHRESGELLALPLSTVLSKYHRGLKKLRKELEGRL